MRYNSESTRSHLEQIKELIRRNPEASARYVQRILSEQNLRLSRNYVTRLVRHATHELTEERIQARSFESEQLKRVVERYERLLDAYDLMKTSLSELRSAIIEIYAELPVKKRIYW